MKKHPRLVRVCIQLIVFLLACKLVMMNGLARLPIRHTTLTEVAIA
ncbi:hypothetical protein [Fibrella arboris]